MISPKGLTNRRFVASQTYRSEWERIFRNPSEEEKKGGENTKVSEEKADKQLGREEGTQSSAEVGDSPEASKGD